jgi:leucyl aminopeptidase
LPTDIHVTLLPAAGPRLLSDYLSAVADGQADPPDLLAVPVRADDLQRGRPELDPFLPAGAAAVIAAAEMTGKAGEIAEAPARLGAHASRVAFLGVGDGSPRALRRAGAELGRRAARGGKLAPGTPAREKPAQEKLAQAEPAQAEPAQAEPAPGEQAPGRTVSTPAIAGLPPDAAQDFVQGLLLGSYAFALKSGPDKARGAEVRLLTEQPADYSAAVGRAVIIAGAVALARDLTNTPSARKSPAWLAAEAASVAGQAGLRSRIWAEDNLASAGFGGILAVGSGSARPPRLIELCYEPPGWQTHVVLVGKGITFDSGGLSLKPNDGMKLMKTDMAGGGAVIAVMSALAGLGVSARVTGLVAAAENMPSGSAYRPGDIVTQYGGRTVEVLNTDAEGRLVLADAIAYADAVLDPGVVVDIATLTGAARIALGTGIGALYSTDDGVAGALLAAGDATGERLWRMPLPADYLDALDSPVADLAHVARSGAAGAKAGSIAAALFLREFTGGRPWAHLDVAGAARASSDDGEITKGGTGFGTRLLLNWLSGI